MFPDTRSVANRFVYDGENYLNYEILGSGPVPVVFIHGFGASLSNWTDICDAFPATEFTLYLIDLKGFGLSSKPSDGNYSMAEQARLVMQLISSLSLSRVALIGHSYGGAIALRLTMSAEEQEMTDVVRKLVLVDPAAYVQDFPSFVGSLRTPILNFIIMRCLSPQWRAKHTLEQTFYNKAKITDSLVDRYARFFVKPGASQSFIWAAKQIVPKDHERITQRYLTITQPSLIIWGRNDSVIPLANGERLHTDIPNSVLRVIEDCGHVPHEECPQETADAIVGFLREE